MRFIAAATVAASLAGAAPASSEIETLLELTTERVSKFEVLTLGGLTLRAGQIYNENFMAAGRGPRAYVQSLRKYSQFGATIDPQLLCLVDSILQELGLGSVLGSSATNCTAAATPGTGTGTGTGAGAGAGTGTGTGTGQGSRPSGQPVGGNGGGNGSRPGNGSAGTGEVAANPQMNDVEYLASVQIGTPPQTVMLNFDTGSSDLWVFSGDTPRVQSQGHQLYVANESTTSSTLQGAQWQITYGDGSGAAGTVFTDVVSVGGVTVRNQAVESATRVSGSFVMDTATSGLLGLAMDSINTVQPTRQKTFFSNAMQTLAMPLFTANLKQGQAGNYNFGFVDQTEFTGSVNFVPVNSTQGFWEFTTSGFTVGQDGQAVNFPHQAIADTGTTLMLMPDEAVQAYYQQVPTAQNNAQVGGFVFDCQAELPSFTAIIGGYQAVVPGSIIKFAPVDGATIATSQTCFGGIQSNTGLPFAIYGDIFLKAQFTVFDGGNMRIGFAPKSGN